MAVRDAGRPARVALLRAARHGACASGAGGRRRAERLPAHGLPFAARLLAGGSLGVCEGALRPRRAGVGVGLPRGGGRPLRGGGAGAQLRGARGQARPLVTLAPQGIRHRALPREGGGHRDPPDGLQRALPGDVCLQARAAHAFVHRQRQGEKRRPRGGVRRAHHAAQERHQQLHPERPGLRPLARGLLRRHQPQRGLPRLQAHGHRGHLPLQAHHALGQGGSGDPLGCGLAVVACRSRAQEGVI